jgi:hypothetical protein
MGPTALPWAARWVPRWGVRMWGRVPHGVAVGWKRGAPLGRARMGAGFPTALPWAGRRMPRWGVRVWARGSPRRCHGLEEGCLVGACAYGAPCGVPYDRNAPSTQDAPVRRTKGAFPSPAHGNAVGKPFPIKPAALKGRPKRPLSTWDPQWRARVPRRCAVGRKKGAPLGRAHVGRRVIGSHHPHKALRSGAPKVHFPRQPTATPWESRPPRNEP